MSFSPQAGRVLVGFTAIPPTEMGMSKLVAFSVVIKREVIVVKPPSLAVGVTHQPSLASWAALLFASWLQNRSMASQSQPLCPLLVQGDAWALLPACPRRARQHGHRSSWKRLAVLCFTGTPWEHTAAYHHDSLLQNLPCLLRALSMFAWVKVSGSWQHLNLSCWPKLKLNNLLFTTLWKQVSEPRLRRYLFSYTTKGMLPKMLSQLFCQLVLVVWSHLVSCT